MCFSKRQIISVLKSLPLLILVVAFFSFFYFHLYRYLSFDTLKQHRQMLLHWTSAHYVRAVCIYLFLYTAAVAIAVPSVILFTLAGGFLFGLWVGACYAIFSDTLGAILFFLAIRISLFDWVEQRSGKWLRKMESGFQKNAFNYLLTLRLIPIFPFWLVNLISALFGMRLSQFIVATLIGLIPTTLIYTSVGQSLGAVFEARQTPNLDIIFEPHIILPLIGLALLAIVPVIYKWAKSR